MPEKKFKKGDKVETIHGEKLVVVEVRTTPDLMKKGVLVRKGQTLILAESGGHPTWFPVENIK